MAIGYIYSGAESQKDFSLDVRATLASNYRIITVSKICHIELYPTQFIKNDGNVTPVTLRLDVERLEQPIDLTGALPLEINVDFFSTDIDQAKIDDIDSIELYKNVVEGVNFSRVGARNIARQSGIAEQSFASYSQSLPVFKRTFYPNVNYLLIVDVIEGQLDTADCILFGTVVEP